ncbi:unnamed protein product [Hyaloperonospora brassicae]|uniref:RxLR effector candidate protein n=1 Tax=Hyaloperonospora brassicae TaxID=162125 RepID=A0AAV0UGA7_HYABA|nr:unnamed protein product [Hyaloperonospora brassicae]
MKPLYFRALIVSGLLSAMFYGAWGGSVREAPAPGAHALDHETVKTAPAPDAHALDHETVKTALSAQATTSAEQEDRGWKIPDVVPFLHGLGPAKFERVPPDTGYIAHLNLDVGKGEGLRRIQAPSPFDGEAERIVEWMALNLFSHVSSMNPPRHSVELAKILEGLSPSRAALVLKHASKLRGTQAWVEMAEQTLAERVTSRKFTDGGNGHVKSPVAGEKAALILSFKWKELQLESLYQRIFFNSAQEPTTLQLEKNVAQQLGDLPLDDAAIVVQIAKKHSKTSKLAEKVQKKLFDQFKRAGYTPEDMEMGWLLPASQFDKSIYGGLVKALIDDYKNAYTWRRYLFG